MSDLAEINTKTGACRLFSPFSLGALQLPNRVVMAPMTRARSAQPGDIPTAQMAEYYAQRASAGLIISEATQVSPQGKGYSFTPGIHSPEQVSGWKLVTDAVHKAGGRIFLQLWHVGRMSHESLHADGQPVAPSALSPDSTVWIADPVTGEGRMLACPLPRALETHEISGVIEDFRRGAANAMAAGFDGVEIHGANGYLVDQFMRSSSNQRTDRYGGCIENRLRFLIEVAEAVATQVGASRTGLRLSPFNTQRNMNDPDIVQVTLDAAREMKRIGLGYIHLAEADWDFAPPVPDEFRLQLRKAFDGTLIVAGKYTKARAEAALETGLSDLVAFGRPFVANPDLPRRLAEGHACNAFDPATLFGGGARGYTDYLPLPG